MLYELVNPSDAYVFQADSFPVAVVAAWMISPMYAVKPEEGEDYFGTMNEQTMKTAQSIAKEENYSVVNCCLSRNFIP